MTDKLEKTSNIVCPVCTKPMVFTEKKKLLGREKFFLCENENCLTKLIPKKEKFLLKNTSDTNSRTWEMYKHKNLTKEEWERISKGGLSDEDQTKEDKTKVLEAIRNRELPLKFNEEVPIILKKNEEPHLFFPNIELHEDRMIRRRVGGAIRVAKGVYLGSSRSESSPERKHIDTGELILTNKRLVFIGARKSVDIDLRKIIGIEPYRDAICINRSNKKNVEWFIGNFGVMKIDVEIEGRKHKFEFDGAFIKYMIEGIISKIG